MNKGSKKNDSNMFFNSFFNRAVGNDQRKKFHQMSEEEKALRLEELWDKVKRYT